jgi:hypothetical protein
MKHLMNSNFSLPRWGRAGVGVAASTRRSLASAACPHPSLPPEGEGARPMTLNL